MCKDVNEIKWFELPNHMCIHYCNSWEEKNKEGHDVITIFGCAMDEIDLDINKEHPFLDKHLYPKLTKWTFNLTTGKSEMKTMINDRALEFPVINQDLMGYKTRYVYLV